MRPKESNIIGTTVVYSFHIFNFEIILSSSDVDKRRDVLFLLSSTKGLRD